MAWPRALGELSVPVRRSLAGSFTATQAWIDYRRPSLRDGWGPLNGQRERQKIVRELFRALDFDRIVETGTMRGTSTEFFSYLSGKPVHTADCDRRFHGYARRRLAPHANVQVVLGDSRALLQTVAAASNPGKETVFFYLDAHFYEDLPTVHEVEIIAGLWPRAVIMIDDFAVPDDDGYGYDDYGPGKALNMDYLPGACLDEWSMYFPAAASAAESGARRGCIVLVPPALEPEAKRLSTLRSLAPSD